MLRRYLAVSIVLLLAASCREKDNGSVDSGAVLTIEEQSGDLRCRKGAQLKVLGFCSGSTVQAVLKNGSEEGSRATFSGEFNGEKGQEYAIYGIYPADSYVSSLSGMRVKLKIPSDQVPLDEGPDPEAGPWVCGPGITTFNGKPEKLEGRFTCLTSTVRLVLSGYPGETVSSVVVDFGSVQVAGTVSVDLDKKAVSSFVGSGGTTVTASPADAPAIDGNHPVCFRIAPTMLSAGAPVVIQVKTNSGYYRKTLTAGDGVPLSFPQGETVTVSCALDQSDELQGGSLRMMSFNVKAGTDGDTGEHNWTSRKVGQKMMMAEWDPDIVAIQEADVAQRRYYAENIPGYTYVTVTGVPQTGADYKQSGLNEIGFRTTRFKLLESGWYWLSETPDQVSLGYSYTGYLTAIYVRLEDKETGHSIYVVCTHLAPAAENNKSRSFTSALVTERTRAFAGENNIVFVMGDMNAANYTGTSVSAYPEQRESIRPFFDWLEDSRNTAVKKVGDYSLNHWGLWTKHSTLNVDMIFYRNLKTADCFTTVTQPYNNTEYISDHYPVVLDCTY